MKQAEFEQFVEAEGKDILCFCRILTASQRQALEEILSQVVIDCSVEYTDGSSASMSVSPSVRIALNTQTAEDSGSDFENEYLEVTIQKQ